MSAFTLNEPIDPDMGQRLVEAAGTSAFAGALLQAAQKLDAVEEVYAYQITPAGVPRTVLSCGERRDVDERTVGYVERFHVLDPIMQARWHPGRGRGFVRHVRADQIPVGSYRDICFASPGFVDKICVGWRGEGLGLVLSFYRGKRSRAEPDRSLASLGGLAMTVLKHHIGLTQRQGDSGQRDPRALLEARLARSFPVLTVRERQVVALTLLGHSAGQIAEELSIRPATVLTYRQRAYQRMAFSQASDFLGALLC
ncbi:LuxR C-terminal-related transcriptional regulator [Bordetella bronchialis]|uniref:LuxR C-terminal-related transcriptional regulator n=1 Tax=Bordetella bronchialis TaxID=463025 RepID=UPI003D027171